MSQFCIRLINRNRQFRIKIISRKKILYQNNQYKQTILYQNNQQIQTILYQNNQQKQTILYQNNQQKQKILYQVISRNRQFCIMCSLDSYSSSIRVLTSVPLLSSVNHRFSFNLFTILLKYMPPTYLTFFFVQKLFALCKISP